MTPFDPFVALALPPDALIDRRVPKTLLIIERRIRGR